MSSTWVVSVQAQSSQEGNVWQSLQSEVSNARSNCSEFTVPKEFKVGSLDTLVTLSDDLSKLDLHVESTLKKIERQYNELDVQQPLEIKNPHVGRQDQLTPAEYLANFQWNSQKYPLGKSLAELAALVQEKLNTLDDEIKTRTAKFIESRNELNTILKRAQGNLLTKDLQDVLVDPVAKESDFFNTKSFQTLIIIVPKRDIKKFLSTYETLDELVVPRSALQFEIEDKDDLTAWRVVVQRSNVESFTTATKACKWGVREFTFSQDYASESDKNREKIEKEMNDAKNRLWGTCYEAYSDLYIALLHMKGIRVFVESVLRFSLPPNFFSAVIQVDPGREKSLLEKLTKRFIREGENIDLFGSKEESEDGLDFFPFVLIHLTV